MLCPFQTEIIRDKYHVGGQHYKEEEIQKFIECLRSLCPAYVKEEKYIPNIGGCTETVERCTRCK